MFWKSKSIKNQLSGFFLLVILIPTVVISIFTYVHQKKTLYESTLKHLQAVSTLKERAIKDWLLEEKQLISLLSNEPFVNKHAVQILTTRKSSVAFKNSYKKLKTYLSSVPNDMIDIRNISILANVGGRTIISTDESLIGQYHLADSFFTLGKKRTYVQRLHHSPTRDEPVMIIATPIKDESGKSIGVMYVMLDPVFVTSLMKENTQLGETGRSYLVDIRKHIITPHYNPDFKNIKINTFTTKQGLRHKSGHGFSTNHEGKEVLSVYRWLPEPKVVLITEIDKDEVYAPLAQFLILLVFTALAIIIGAFLVAITIANRISRPILALTDTAQGIANGDLGMRAPIVTHDEIGILSKAFNEMTSSLQETISDKDNAYYTLEKTNQHLEQATRAKSTFLANMSHELRTPLHAIIGFSQLMASEKEKFLEPEWHEYIISINTAGNHLLTLISDLLDFSKIEAGKLELNAEEFEIKKLLDDIIRIAQPLTENKNNQFTITGLDDVDKMVGDTTRLQQVLLNLLSNSAKFTENGEIILTVRSLHEDEIDWICFQVIDNGIGIAESEVENVFGVFTQADASTTRKYGGSGLGLAISKYLCESMGGSISVESKENVGTSFTIKIPKQIDTQNLEQTA